MLPTDLLVHYPPWKQIARLENLVARSEHAQVLSEQWAAPWSRCAKVVA